MNIAFPRHFMQTKLHPMSYNCHIHVIAYNAASYRGMNYRHHMSFRSLSCCHCHINWQLTVTSTWIQALKGCITIMLIMKMPSKEELGYKIWISFYQDCKTAELIFFCREILKSEIPCINQRIFAHPFNKIKADKNFKAKIHNFSTTPE